MIPIFEQAQRFTELWANLASKMTAATLAGSSSAPPEAAREIRSAIFQSMSQSAEDFLRSPIFLEIMKQTLDATFACRKQANDFLTAMHHNTQSIARQDIDSLMLLIRHLETRVLDRMEDISARMDQVGSRLAALEAPQPSGKSEEQTPKQKNQE